MASKGTHHLSDSEIVREIPIACSDETAAVEFFERKRWGDTPCCVHCGSTNAYKMVDAKTGERNKRFLWRCREKECKKQYTVRIGTVYEESRLPLRHWAYAFWRASTSKKGVAALEIKRHCQIGYRAALFLMNRIRFAMAPDQSSAPKLSGIVECDEVYVGGKPRRGHSLTLGYRGIKTPVFVAVERGGEMRRRVMRNVTGRNVKIAMREVIDSQARIHTDESSVYTTVGKEFAGGHETVCHSTGEYVRGDVHNNTAESSNALIKRGLMGIYHSVSKEYLHRYLWQWDFCWNNREMNDGERTLAAIKSASGKRLMYKSPKGASATKPLPGEQLWPFDC